MTTKYRAETATVAFGFAVNNPDGSGAADADSTPSAFLRAVGTTASDAPITTGVSVSLLSNAGYPDGLYEAIVNGTTASLSADTEYEVYVSATVDSVVSTGMIGTLVTTTLMDATGIRAAFGMAAATYDTDIANLPTTAEFNARTIISADYALQGTSDGIANSLSDYESGTTKIEVNTMQINSSATAATQLALSAAAIESGAAEGTPSTTVIQTDLAETQDDIYIGRVVIFTSGAARGEATSITDYTGATGTLTVTALANAPSAADTFVVL